MPQGWREEAKASSRHFFLPTSCTEPRQVSLDSSRSGPHLLRESIDLAACRHSSSSMTRGSAQPRHRQRQTRQPGASGQALEAATSTPGPSGKVTPAGVSGLGLNVAAILLATLLAGLLAWRPIADSDFWHHLTLGGIVATEHRFPVADELGSTSGGRWWVSSGWLVSVGLYALYQYLAVQLLVWLCAALPAVWLIWRASRKNPSAGPAATLLVFLMIAAAYPRLLPRPDVASMALMIPLAALLTSFQYRPLAPGFAGWRRAALLPTLFLLWVNCHMLFVVGLFVAGLFVAWALWQWRLGRRPDGPILASAWLASLVITLINPYGWKVYWFIWANAQLSHVGQRINELSPLWTITPGSGAGPMLLLLGAWAVIAGWFTWRLASQRRLSAWQLASVMFLVGLALIQRRQVGLATFGITGLLVEALVHQPATPANAAAKAFGASSSRLLRWVGALTAGAGLCAIAAAGWLPMVPALGSGVSRRAPDAEWLPQEAIGFLRQNPPPPRLFHDLYTGSYLASQLVPATKVFIDGRLEVYNNGVFDAVFAPAEGKMSALEVFDKYSVQSALLDWRAAATQPGHLAAILSDNPHWQLCWFSDHYALFVRSGGPWVSDEANAYAKDHGYRLLNPLRPAIFTAAAGDTGRAAQAQAEARRALQQNPGSHLAQMAAKVAGLSAP